MRLLGSVLLAVCCVLYGMGLSTRVRNHRRQLESAQLFWKGIRAELLSRRSTPEELFCSRMENREFVSQLSFLPAIVTRLKEGASFPAAFELGMAQSDGWEGEELVCQKRLGAVLGQVPLEEQLDALSLLVETLEDRLVNVRQEEQRQCRFYRSMGLAAGAAVIILLF